MKNYLLGVFSVLLISVACSMGGRSFKANEFPVRANEFTFFMYDKVRDIFFKRECEKWTKKNECKETNDKILPKSDYPNYFLVHKTQYFKLIGVK